MKLQIKPKEQIETRTTINLPLNQGVNVNGDQQNTKLTLTTNGLSETKLTIRTPAQPQQPGTVQLQLNPQTKVTTQGPTADAYVQYSPRTHAYMRPDMYVGGDERTSRDEWVFDQETQRMVMQTIDFTPACIQLFLEVLTNGVDNANRSRREGVDPGAIDITMTNKTISITNYGLPLPIEQTTMKENGKTVTGYVPQKVLGNLLTSSNYTGTRYDAGTNGIGAKATNIFSKQFLVIIHDHIRHLKYTQCWTNNMKERTEPVIEQHLGQTSSVQIVYEMDFARFGYPVPVGNEGGYPPEAFSLFTRLAVDASFTTKIPISFNGQVFNYSNIRDYARLYFGDAVENAIVHYQWPEGTEIIKKKKGYQVAKNPAISPLVELIVTDTPDEGRHVSFVNCVMTKEGGVHVNAATKAVGDTAVQMINESMIKKLTKQNRGKDLDAKEKRAHTINIGDVKPHISILLSVRVENPKFTSQTKTTLHSPTPKIVVGEEELQAMNRWQLIDRLYATLEAKQFASMAKTDGKKRRHPRLQKGIDAFYASSNKASERHQCVLYITEGLSGSSYATTLIGLVNRGSDYIGVLPMRGKSLNVMNAGILQIEKNTEIAELKQMLGLQEGVDYSIQENFNRLRYGQIMIMADSDVDGKHIIGLLLNYFHCRFPSLLARQYILYYCTPIIRVTKGKQVLKFYTDRDYQDWKNVTEKYAEWDHQYYKGLGSSSDPEIADDYSNPKIIQFYYDQHAPDYIRLAFDKKLTDQRKDWIGRWNSEAAIYLNSPQPISTFMNQEFILFSIADTNRSIPKLMDGFKESHRKIMHGAHLKWKIGSKKSYTKCKVAQFSAFVAEKVNYHHGEVILDNVIVGMAQDFTGSNNLPWFTRDGQFGSRYQGGRDAAKTRYSHTHPEKLVQYVMRKEDRPLLKHIVDEGQEVEPEFYYQVIPMILVNGGEGIGTGYSTFIPCHNPLDLVKWLKLKLNGVTDEGLPDLLPWYRGFTGTIKVIDRRHRKRRNTVKVITIQRNQDESADATAPTVAVTEEVDDKDDQYSPEDEDLPGDIQGEEDEDYYRRDPHDQSRPLLSMVSLGNFHMDLNGTIFVTELPIGRWTLTYRRWLEQLREDKVITDFRDSSNKHRPSFEIYGYKDTPTYQKLKLKRTFGMSNMVLLDNSNRPIRYDTAFDIIESFYCQRLPIYQKRKDYMLTKLTQDVAYLHNKLKYIRAVTAKKDDPNKLHTKGRKKEEVYLDMDRLGIPRELYGKITRSHESEDEIGVLLKEIDEKQQEYRNLEQTTLQALWLHDLDEFETAYRSVYKLKSQSIKLSITQ